jgi:hypothetical protein
LAQPQGPCQLAPSAAYDQLGKIDQWLLRWQPEHAMAIVASTLGVYEILPTKMKIGDDRQVWWLVVAMNGGS